MAELVVEQSQILPKEGDISPNITETIIDQNSQERRVSTDPSTNNNEDVLNMSTQMTTNSLSKKTNQPLGTYTPIAENLQDIGIKNGINSTVNRFSQMSSSPSEDEDSLLIETKSLLQNEITPTTPQGASLTGVTSPEVKALRSQLASELIQNKALKNQIEKLYKKIQEDLQKISEHPLALERIKVQSTATILSQLEQVRAAAQLNQDTLSEIIRKDKKKIKELEESLTSITETNRTLEAQLEQSNLIASTVAANPFFAQGMTTEGVDGSLERKDTPIVSSPEIIKTEPAQIVESERILAATRDAYTSIITKVPSNYTEAATNLQRRYDTLIHEPSHSYEHPSNISTQAMTENEGDVLTSSTEKTSGGEVIPSTTEGDTAIYALSDAQIDDKKNTEEIITTTPPQITTNTITIITENVTGEAQQTTVDQLPIEDTESVIPNTINQIETIPTTEIEILPEKDIVEPSEKLSQPQIIAIPKKDLEQLSTISPEQKPKGIGLEDVKKILSAISQNESPEKVLRAQLESPLGLREESLGITK